MRLHTPALLVLAVGCRVGTKANDGDAADDTASLAQVDQDGDGFSADEDCDDDDASVHPGATEVCDGVDNDCDGDIDEGVTGTWYVDADGDGYGDAGAPVEACSQPSGTASSATDCDDADADTHPAATELCNGIDDDCDGDIDEELLETWYTDADGDGYGDPGAAVEACEQPSDAVDDATDCDDADGAVHPEADELCNGVDDDCDGDIDEDALDALTWYLDADGDGYGDPAAATTGCTQPSGTVTDASDCDDLDLAIHPDATEVCNGVDDDCDGDVDDDDASLDASTGSTWYADADGDGYGDASAATQACTQPSGTVSDDSDCDDGDAATNPGALDVCNGIDDNCDGDVDEEALDGMMLLSIDTNDGVAYEIDPATGALTSLATLGTSGAINSVAVSGSTTLGHDYQNDRLTELDVCAGTESPLTSHGTDANTCGISFGPGGRLFGIDSINDELVEYDPATGQLTVIGALGFDLGSCGLAYDCTNDVLIGADGSSDTVFKVDATTGEAYDAVSVGFDFSSVGLEFDPVTQSVLASDRTNLYDVDLATGSSTLLGAMSASNIDDLLYHPECP